MVYKWFLLLDNSIPAKAICHVSIGDEMVAVLNVTLAPLLAVEQGDCIVLKRRL